MNRLIENRHDLLDLSLHLRDEVLDALGDADLAFRLPGNPSFGDILADFGSVEAAYTRSFREFALRFDQTAPTLDSVAALRSWFAAARLPSRCSLLNSLKRHHARGCPAPSGILLLL